MLLCSSNALEIKEHINMVISDSINADVVVGILEIRFIYTMPKKNG